LSSVNGSYFAIAQQLPRENSYWLVSPTAQPVQIILPAKTQA